MEQLSAKRSRPAAAAQISGFGSFSSITGTVSFTRHENGVLVSADIYGLPNGPGDKAPCTARVFGFHIHEGKSCSGPGLADTGGHYNPDNCTHPRHAGDLPPLFGCKGRAYLVVLTDRFSIPEIIGRTVVIHADPDDFMTQPSGHSGEKIACGVIRAV